MHGEGSTLRKCQIIQRNSEEELAIVGQLSTMLYTYHVDIGRMLAFDMDLAMKRYVFVMFILRRPV